jgi:acetyl-CoA carboxylase alpha subunit
VIDAIVPEPSGGAHRDHDRAARLLDDAIQAALLELGELSPGERRRLRRAKFRAMGVWGTSEGAGAELEALALAPEPDPA